MSNDNLPIYYTEDWKAWQDPTCPDYLDPTSNYLDRHANGPLAEKTALICDQDQLSYRALLEETCRFASGLAAAGCRRESRMLMFGSDSIEYIAAWLGAVRSGIVPVVVSDAHKDHHLKYFLEDTAASTLFIDEEQLPKLASIADQIPATLECILVRGSAAAIQGKVPAAVVVTEIADLRKNAATHFKPVLRHRHDLCYMFYSGGTTGTPKGVTHLTHDLEIVPQRHGAFWIYEQNDVVHATSKKSFTHGLWPGVLIPLYWGATSVITREPVTGSSLIELIERTQPDKLITVPTLIKLLLAEVEAREKKPNFSSLKFVVAASEKMAPELFERFYAAFGIELMDSIGSSEITYEWIANRQKDFRRGSLGKPVFGVQIKLTDDQGKDITEPNTVGDVWVNSVTRCFYYWRKLDQTQSTFHGPWVRTGDQLYFDEDGYFWFASRSDDVFKVKGLWVSPTEVEAVITGHPAVLEAAVIGVEASDGMMVPRAFVVLRKQTSEHDAIAAELMEMIRSSIGGYKVPDKIEFMDALPRTPLMKISRKSLRDALKESLLK
ncbi:benzoate-CoA ligase family protein [Lacisediminimonas sp.]|uniref:benzoate-CoA ligase family protein n=1 Tax=Lacisediminimonas sp. TaxID=3060582 RepID=UPI00271C880E|nr:benzoate-CoA ligase family protein [Lacisediminimonas sp.]MDO8300692.1 benzoate-CoA ligase family protein [Lacisediminimonas sp.]